MGGFVSVNPNRLKQLADALQEAVGILTTNEKAIVNTLDGWNATWSSAQVDALASWLDHQWHPMQDRAEYAEFAENQAVVTYAGDPHADWRGVPWDLTDADLSNEALQEARVFTTKLASSDPATVAQAQQELADAMTAHTLDPSWLQAFANAGGMSVVDTANKSLLGQHIPVSTQAQQALSAYANGVAATTKMSENGQITVSPTAFAQLYSDGSVMSTGTMMKFGPAGTAYGSQFLANAAAAALTWRTENPPPDYSAPAVIGGQYIPGGYIQDGGSWWTKYGLNIDYVTVGSNDAATRIQTIRDYDPALSILNITGDNQVASQDLLTGPAGLQHAQQLVQYNWATPPGLDDSAPASKVISAATLDRSGLAAAPSAQAAANIFQAGYQLSTNDPRNDYTKGLYPRLPTTLAQTLAVVASAYAPDLALSTGETHPDVNGVGLDPNVPGGTAVVTNTSVIDGYLKLFMTDPKAAGTFQGAVNAQLQVAAVLAVKDPKAPDLLYDTGYLDGLTQIAISTQKFDAAAAKDVANAQNATYLNATANFVWGALGLLPGAGSAVGGFLGGTTAAITTAVGNTLFPTNATSTYTAGEQYTLNAEAGDMRYYIAQGYAQSGAWPLPPNPSFVHNGVIAPQNAAEIKDFTNWYLPGSTVPLQHSASDGFREAAGAYASNDDKFKKPQS